MSRGRAAQAGPDRAQLWESVGGSLLRRVGVPRLVCIHNYDHQKSQMRRVTAVLREIAEEHAAEPNRARAIGMGDINFTPSHGDRVGEARL